MESLPNLEKINGMHLTFRRIRNMRVLWHLLELTVSPPKSFFVSVLNTCISNYVWETLKQNVPVRTLAPPSSVGFLWTPNTLAQKPYILGRNPLVSQQLETRGLFQNKGFETLLISNFVSILVSVVTLRQTTALGCSAGTGAESTWPSTVLLKGGK